MDPQSASKAAAVVNGATQKAVAAISGASQAIVHSGFALFMDGVYYAVMVPLVYVAVAAMIVGIVAKIASIAASPAPAFTLKTFPVKKHPMLAALVDTFAMPQIRKRRPLFWFFLMWFHLGILALILGHFDLFPNVNIMPAASKHMIGAGFVGLSVTIPAFYFLGRRFSGENRHISVPSDYLLLLILIFTFLLGDMISWGNSWTAHGFVMTKADFKQYFGILAGFTFADPKTVLPGSHYHFIVLHVFLAEIFMVILPFSKIVHTFFSLPLNALRRK